MNENIKAEIISKINNVMNREPLSAIDYDLMLDYTRSLYEVILKERSNASSKGSIEGVVIGSNREVNNLEANKGVENSKDLESEEKLESKNEVGIEQQLLPEDDKPVITSNIEREAQPVEIQEEIKQTPFAPPSFISFELPPQVKTETPVALRSDVPVEINKKSESDKLKEIPKAEEVFKTVVPDLFERVPSAKRDIRNSIGFNDKYLFLNELFNNQKQDYEEALDYINNLKTFDEASDWLNDNSSKQFNWKKEDSTCNAFYSIVHKHFSFTR